MRTVTIPRKMSHVRQYGTVLCITCQETCRRGSRCQCCRELLRLC